MGANSSIEWTESTWNPLTGCTKISPGCTHCYAERMARRLHGMGQARYANGFRLTLHRDLLDLPLKWRKPQTIFVNSMSDLFHSSVPEEFVLSVFQVMARVDWHCFQVLTKRTARLVEISPKLQWPPNVWMGVSVESERYRHRIDHLRESGAQIRFLSLEPLLGPLPKLNLTNIDWVILGGESGPGARPLEIGWARDVRDQCASAGIPFFFKQWGGVNKKKTGRELDGRTWVQLPVHRT